MSKFIKSVNRLSLFFASPAPKTIPASEVNPVSEALEDYVPMPVPFDQGYVDHYEEATEERIAYYEKRIWVLQRRLSKKHAEELARSYTNGYFFSELAVVDMQDGKLKNGQHTLYALKLILAIIKGSDRGLKFHVRVWKSGLPIAQAFDRALKTRSFQDIMRINGCEVDGDFHGALNVLDYIHVGYTRKNPEENLRPYHVRYADTYAAIRKVVTDDTYQIACVLGSFTAMYELAPKEVKQLAYNISNNIDCPKGSPGWRIQQLVTAVDKNGKRISITGGYRYIAMRQIMTAIKRYIEKGNKRMGDLTEDREMPKHLATLSGIIPPSYKTDMEALARQIAEENAARDAVANGRAIEA